MKNIIKKWFGGFKLGLWIFIGLFLFGSISIWMQSASIIDKWSAWGGYIGGISTVFAIAFAGYEYIKYTRDRAIEEKVILISKHVSKLNDLKSGVWEMISIMSCSYSSPDLRDKEQDEEELENIKQVANEFGYIKKEVLSLIDVISIRNPHSQTRNNKIKKDFDSCLTKVSDDLRCVQVCIENKVGNKSIYSKFNKYNEPDRFSLYNDLDCIKQEMIECAQSDGCIYTELLFDKNLILENVPSVRNYINQYDLAIESLTDIT